MQSLAFKIVAFFLPKLAGWIFDWIESALQLVQAAEAIEDPSARREKVLASLHELTAGYLPASMLAVLIEIALVLLRLGITPQAVDEMERILLNTDLSSADEKEILNKFLTLFPDVPERGARLLFEYALMKLGWK